MQILNQYSYLFLSLFVLLGSIVAASLWFPGFVGLMIVLIVGVGLVVVGSVFQYQDTDASSGTVPDALIGKGLPVLLAVYSNF